MIPKILKNKKFLIFAGVILILSLFLPIRAYVYKNVINKPPVVHSVVRFDPKVEKNISLGDILEGKGIPNAKVSISITPNGVSEEVSVGSDSKWSFQVPINLEPRNYNLTITLKDVIGNIASIKSYLIVIPAKAGSHKNTLFNGSPIRSGMTLEIIKPAYAQGSTTQTCSAFPHPP